MANPKDELIAVLMDTVSLEASVAEQEARNRETERTLNGLRKAVEDIRACEEQSLKLRLAASELKALDIQAQRVADIAKLKSLTDQAEHLKSLVSRAGASVQKREIPTVLQYLESAYEQKKRLQDDGRRHMKHYIRTFARIVGDKSLADYTATDVVSWVRTLEKIKKSFGKSPRDAIITVEELLKDSEGKPTLGVTTLEKHITHVKDFFQSANKDIRWGPMDEVVSIFEDVELSDFVPGVEKRKTWSIDHLNKLFASPIWSGTGSRKEDLSKRYIPGPDIFRDAYWWLPVVALWTGARLEEIAQLRKEDLVFDANGIACININDDGPRRLKTENSRRLVPIHSNLRRLGFLDLFEQADQECQIFTELSPTGRLKKLGDTYSGHFTNYRRRCGIYEPLMDFHSLRRTFITTLRNKAKIDVMTVAALVGHDDDLPALERFRQTDDYTDYDAADLAEAVEALDYEALGLDIMCLKGR
ncbi:site-specific integrase [Caenispirillum bisanense]|uniref:site-specific integrase n=1 Tax=Caenispirillum bisanense TaxID=414052 RepID=UPI0015965DFD|nr:site-specific integrase [Caenispirillum bisanense]